LLTAVLVKAETGDTSSSTVYLGSLQASGAYDAGTMSINTEKLRINSYHNAVFNSKADGISVGELVSAILQPIIIFNRQLWARLAIPLP
jgi:hypothetical protein